MKKKKRKRKRTLQTWTEFNENTEEIKQIGPFFYYHRKKSKQKMTLFPDICMHIHLNSVLTLFKINS